MELEDFDAVNAAALASLDSLLAQWFPNGVVDGAEFCIGSLSGEAGKSLRVRLKGDKAGFWSDFSMDGEAGRDPISLYAAKESISQGKACAHLARALGIAIHGADKVKRIPNGTPHLPQKSAPAQAGKGVGAPPKEKKSTSSWCPILPIPEAALPYPVAHPVRGRPQMVWEYRDQQRQLLGIVCRFVTSDGGKEVLPCVYAQDENTGNRKWHWIQWREPRPLYLPQPLREGFPVLVVEGEKCADAARAAVGDAWDVVSWPGGGKAVKKVDWSLLAGRSLLLWADADAQRYKENHAKAGEIKPEVEQPGMVAMQAVAELNFAQGCSIQFVDIPPPGEVEDGWDVADLIAAGGTKEDVCAWLAHVRPAWVAEPLEEAAAPASPASVSDDGVPAWVDAPTPEDVPHRPAGAGSMDRAQIKAMMLYGATGVKPCRENVFLALTHDPDLQGIVAFDKFSELLMKRRDPPWESEPGEWTESDDFFLGLFLGQHYRLIVSSIGEIEKAVAQVARRHAFNPVTDYMSECEAKWDGQPRVADAFHRYWGAEDSDYIRLVSTMFLVGLAARAYVPGIKHDCAPVFEGGQGAGKSTALEVLGGAWYADTPFRMGEKDGYLSIQGILLYEVAELEQFNRSEVTAVKAFMSSKKDRFREPYGRRMRNLPRRTLFAATTNEGQYFKDPTGSRRFWPVKCGRVDTVGLAEVRDQLFGEAVAMWRKGVKWYATRDQDVRLIMPAQDDREIPDQWIGRLYDYVEGIDADGNSSSVRKLDRVTARELLTRALHIEIGKLSQSKNETMRISACMRKLGWEKERDPYGAREYFYVRPKPAVVEPKMAEEGDYAIPF